MVPYALLVYLDICSQLFSRHYVLICHIVKSMSLLVVSIKMTPCNDLIKALKFYHCCLLIASHEAMMAYRLKIMKQSTVIFIYHFFLLRLIIQAQLGFYSLFSLLIW